MRTTPTTTRNRQAGFSFTDTVVAMVIMGSIFSLMVPLFLHGASFDQAYARRHAQEFCSICYEAQKAGVNFVVDSDVTATVQNLMRGGESTSGRSFKAQGLTDSDATAAAKFLRVESGSLVVNLAGS